jgi:hypothetical protein
MAQDSRKIDSKVLPPSSLPLSRLLLQPPLPTAAGGLAGASAIGLQDSRIAWTGIFARQVDTTMFLGIDIGTGSSKAVLADAGGAIVDRAFVTHDVQLPHPGWAEFDAEAVWWNEIAVLSHELFSRNDAGSLQGVCVSGMGPCLVVTDDTFTPLRPAILYGPKSSARTVSSRPAERIFPRRPWDPSCGGWPITSRRHFPGQRIGLA